MREWILLDGATGTMLQAAGLPLGQRPEIFAIQHPEILEAIQRQYVHAGSRVLCSNTFGANAHKLANTDYSVEEVIAANIAIAKRAADGKARVALDIGSIGALLEPLGNLSFDEAYAIFAQMVRAGASAGADIVLIETMSDLAEVRAAVLAAKENCALPVWVTMSFEKNGRTFTGTTIPAMAVTLDALGVDAMGINCSLAPDAIAPLIAEMRSWTDKPLIVKPNAGLPDPATGKYTLSAKDFARQMARFAQMGIYMLGGCCGTTPEYIAELAKLDMPSEDVRPTRKRGVCSVGHIAEYGRLCVVGERINPTGKKRLQQALREQDMNYIMECAVAQQEAGADILDINVGLPGVDEVAMMRQAVKAVQSVVTLPMQIDSNKPEVIEAGLRVCAGRAIVNSVNADAETLERVLPIVKKYGAAVVGLTMDKHGIPSTAEERFAHAETILAAALRHGIAREDVIIDCLTLTVSAQQEQAIETLKAVRMVRERLGLHCILGVSNISFGLPERNNITVNFLTQAIAYGLDFAIVNPNAKPVMDAIASARALSGEDMGCAAYIRRFADAAPTIQNAVSEKLTIQDAIYKGLSHETALRAQEMLESTAPLDVVNCALIPALDAVGEAYERQRIFLPQLIRAAKAACAGFDCVRERIAQSGGQSVSKGKILLATVEGDIHDIGKNITRVVLENYGYTVIDLGRDVPVQRIVDTAIQENISLVGLSALMTTTVESMKRTIAALRKAHTCKIMVGGAVLTEEYAKEIGADYYVKDAKASADAAKIVLG